MNPINVTGIKTKINCSYWNGQNSSKFEPIHLASCRGIECPVKDIAKKNSDKKKEIQKQAVEAETKELYEEFESDVDLSQIPY